METLKNLYVSYIVDVLDILILTFLFYRVILMIKGTKAIQILLGILVILALTVIARDVLQLKALTLLLNNFWLAAVIIFTVVFQTEIRNFLAQIGSQIWGTGTGVKNKHVQEIVEASEDLSVSMAGGLIAIENDVGLRNFAETGVMLNANISKELLLSIFKNKSAPLHDGAVIINNDKIVAAGCLLPLSNDMNVKIFGTRHRAALGLSEITDAIIIVVSEETGQISVAYKGRLRGNITTQKLAEIIDTNGKVLNLK
ncbi:MAG: diadenylate cyclase CdaA [Endomicrobia bacterium]|nr:diadenylate cyclase CdaA [Endomicrobiia bacterium]MCL2799767.1 diadenylate cyclase CdaA [Endomicrobiia bacterium]